MDSIPKIKKWQPIIVEWLDATGSRESHGSEEYVASYNPMIRRTVGFFLHSNEHGVFMSETDDRLGVLHQDCENITVVPLPMIRSLTVLEVSAPLQGSPLLVEQSKPQRKLPRQR